MEKKKSTLSQLLEYAGNYKALTFVGCALSAIAMIVSMFPYICIWLMIRDLVKAAPDYASAVEISRYGWLAFVFALTGILVYFVALMCTHLAAFRTAENIRKQGMKKLMKAPLGYFDNNASGLIRNRLDGAASETETLLAHNLADIVGTVAMFIGMLIMLFVFDWRMGLVCIVTALVSVMAMFSMMGGKNAGLMTEYQAAQDRMAKAGTEYVRGIPVVKIFQQTIDSFKAFKQSIEEYSDKAGYYQGTVCRVPQAINLTFTEGAFVFLVPVTILLAPAVLENGSFTEFVINYAFYAIFSAVISTALAKVMFAASGMMMADTALNRIKMITEAPELVISDKPQMPKDNSITFNNVTFYYDRDNEAALKNVSFKVAPGETVALVGPSGGGKTTAASLIPRFFDVSEGSVEVGQVNVKDIDPKVLMEHVAFVFQNSRLFKRSIMENVRIARPEATDEEVYKALEAAQCSDILNKLPDGADTIIGAKGTYLSGGEQQRIALARAILKDAPIIVLDEATAFADPENESLIQKALTSLTRNKTVVMIAHRLSTVTKADRIIVLDKGEAVQIGTHEQLRKADGLYSRMWNDYNEALSWKMKKENEVL